MAMLIEPLALRTPIAGFNGGIFVKPDMTITEERLLAADVASRVHGIILNHGMDVWIYSGKDWLIRDRNAPHVAREQGTVKFAPTIVENSKNVLDSVVKIVGVSDDLDLVARCERDVQDALGNGSVGGPLATLLPRCYTSRCQQGNRRCDFVEAAIGSNGQDRDHRRHVERRANVP